MRLGLFASFITNLPLQITGYTNQGINQAISRNNRGVKPSAILHTIKYPKKTSVRRGGKGMAYKLSGKKSTVVVSKRGKIITTYGKGKGNTRLRKAKK